MLNTNEGLESLGSFNWLLSLCLILSWIIVFLCLIKGVKSSGKVVYFTTSFPYVVLTILVVVGTLTKGARQGINFYLQPNWSKLKDYNVWMDAAGQIFFSLSCSMGGIHTLSSYNDFNNNILRDTIIISIGNSLTSIFAGFAIFSIIGHMAFITKTSVSKIASTGTSLAFIAYPEALSHLPIPTFWAILFFFMLLTLGLDSQFAGVETVSTVIFDAMKVTESVNKRRMVINGLICFVGVLLGIPFMFGSGIYLFELFNYYTAAWGLSFVALMESISIIFIYGSTNLIEDIEFMIGKRRKSSWIFFRIAWIIMIIIILISLTLPLVKIKLFKYTTYEYPTWANFIGVLITSCPVILILSFILKHYIFYENKNSESFSQIIMNMTKPSKMWGPALKINRTGKYKEWSTCTE